MHDKLPEAEYRLCARPVHANWSKYWGGRGLKKQFFVPGAHMKRVSMSILCVCMKQGKKRQKQLWRTQFKLGLKPYLRLDLAVGRLIITSVRVSTHEWTSVGIYLS